MNKRARNRLVGVTAIILIVAAVLLVTVLPSGGSYEQKVADIVSDAKLIGTRVKVTGAVVAGSWNKKTNPMVFKIREQGSTTGPEVKVVYNGSAPNTFGNDTIAILTGTVSEKGVVEANEMLTKCPSKYETKSDAASIKEMLVAPPDTPIRVTGFLKPGSLKDAASAERFVLSSSADGSGQSVPVSFAGAMPEGATDGTELVIFGQLENGVFVSTDVSVAQ